MTREQIERAAEEFAEREYEINYADRDYLHKGFYHGAQWRINSVWHKPSTYGDELERNVKVIVKTKQGYRFGRFDVVGSFHEYIAFVSTSYFKYALSDVLEYAYLEDLLPERKEETE